MCSKNDTNTTITLDFGPLTVREWLLVAALGLIFLCGMIGNLLVIHAFGYKKTSRHTSSTERLILYLAIIDFFASIFNPLLFMYLTITRYIKWHFGYIGCKILPAFGPITTTASAGMLLLFAVDRYQAIGSPFQGELSPKTITNPTVIVIMISVLFNIHYIHAVELTKMYGCRVSQAESLHYGVPNCTLIVLRLSVFLFVFMYTHAKIFVALQKRNKSPSFDHRMADDRKSQSKQIIRCILIMGIVHLLLVFPRDILYFIYNMSWLVSTCGIRFGKKIVVVNVFTKLLQVANSCANVFIYSQMHLYYRKCLFKVLHSFGISSSKTFQMIQSNIWRYSQNSLKRKLRKANSKQDNISLEDMELYKEENQPLEENN